jgi:RNAse (barnase) inhibitor barstar
MSWQVALVMDTATDLNVAIGEMPIWAQETPERRAYAPELRESWDSMWHPDPGFTLITGPPAVDLERSSAAMLPTIETHHPNLFCVHLFGVKKSDQLNSAMTEFGYYPAPVDWENGVSFVRPFEECAKELALDASGWDMKSDWYWMQDFYSAFFLAVGAPEWHGSNFDALDDSITGGGINKIEVPYRIVIRNAVCENEMVKSMLRELTDFVHVIHSNGCPVSLTIQE